MILSLNQEVKPMSAKYSESYKATIIQRYEAGEELKELGSELHIALSTLYRWRDQYCSTHTPQRIYTPKEITALAKKLQRAEHLLAIIRQSGCLDQIPLSKRLDALEAIYKQPDNPYNVHELCDALQVARGTFYNHIFRRADRSRQQSEKEQLLQLVQQTFDRSQQRFGAKKIRTLLMEKGIIISVKRVSSMMQELGLKSIRPEAKAEYLKRERQAKKNLLNRNFTADHPNQIWVSDITQFRVNDYWLYLCIILDLYSRKIVGYRVSRNSSTNLVTSTFKNACQERGEPQGLTFHSDRGKQYTSGAFTRLLEAKHVKQSFSNSGRPCDNAVAESFFANFKKEEAYRRDYTSERSFCKSVERYIHFYNEERPHATLANRTPAAFEASHCKQK